MRSGGPHTASIIITLRFAKKEKRKKKRKEKMGIEADRHPPWDLQLWAAAAVAAAAAGAA